MKFVLAPDWFMALPDTQVLQKKHVWELYQHHQHQSIAYMVKQGGVPAPDVKIKHGKCYRYGWTVGYLKNFLKLPTELNHKHKTPTAV